MKFICSILGCDPDIITIEQRELITHKFDGTIYDGGIVWVEEVICSRCHKTLSVKRLDNGTTFI